MGAMKRYMVIDVETNDFVEVDLSWKEACDLAQSDDCYAVQVDREATDYWAQQGDDCGEIFAKMEEAL